MNGRRMGILLASVVATVALGGSALAQGQKATAPAPVKKTVTKVKIENLRQGWSAMPAHGKWTLISDTEVRQTVDDVREMYAANTGFGRAVEQSGVVEYAWSLNADSLKHGCGFYVMATDGEKEERGNGYLLWLTQTPSNSLAIMKMTGNRPPVEQAKFPVTASEKKFNDLRARYDSAKGEWSLACNGKVAGRWKDPQPYKQGRFVSFTTCLTKASIKNVSITRLE